MRARRSRIRGVTVAWVRRYWTSSMDLTTLALVHCRPVLQPCRRPRLSTTANATRPALPAAHVVARSRAAAVGTSGTGRTRIRAIPADPSRLPSLSTASAK